MQAPNRSLGSLKLTESWLKLLSIDLHALSSFPVIVLSRKRRLMSPLEAVRSIIGPPAMFPPLFETLVAMLDNDNVSSGHESAFPATLSDATDVDVRSVGSILMLSKENGAEFPPS